MKDILCSVAISFTLSWTPGGRKLSPEGGRPRPSQQSRESQSLCWRDVCRRLLLAASLNTSDLKGFWSWIFKNHSMQNLKDADCRGPGTGREESRCSLPRLLSIIGGHRARVSCVQDYCPNVLVRLCISQAGREVGFTIITYLHEKGLFVPVFSFRLSCLWTYFVLFNFFKLHKITCLCYYSLSGLIVTQLPESEAYTSSWIP